MVQAGPPPAGLAARLVHGCARLEGAHWPAVTVLVCLHEDEHAALRCIDALLQQHYPGDRVRLVLVDEPGSDASGALVDTLARRHPGRVRPLRRSGAVPGREAALRDALWAVETDLFIVCEARHRAGPQLLRQLVAPFHDPEVGAVDGSADPSARHGGLRPRLMALAAGGRRERARAAGARTGPAPDGAVRAVRLAALHGAGGAASQALAPDGDLEERLHCAGWRSVSLALDLADDAPPPTWAVLARQAAPHARRALPVLGQAWIACALLAGLAPAALAAPWIPILALATLAWPGADLARVVAGARRERRPQALRLLAFGWMAGAVAAAAAVRGTRTAPHRPAVAPAVAPAAAAVAPPAPAPVPAPVPVAAAPLREEEAAVPEVLS